ncbi:abortive infection family protein [Streptomyces sp. NPDC054855]
MGALPVTTLLGLNADAVADHAKASATVVKILRTPTTTVQGPAELRNQLGLDHGRAHQVRRCRAVPGSR